MLRHIISGSIALAMASAAATGAAWGQENPAPDADAKVGQSITVMAPRARESGTTYGGVPIETLTAQSAVYFDDLDLGTQAGRNELDARVEQAAQTACDWIDEVYPLSYPLSTTLEPDDCVRDAVSRAQEQVDAVVANPM